VQISENSNVPFITTLQMVEVDRLMMEEYRILLPQMMENAGRGLARLARERFLDGDPRGKRVVVLAGSGGNGGGGLVGARRLHTWGAAVEVWLATPSQKMGIVPAQQLAILERMGVIGNAMEGEGVQLPAADLIIDAVIGYSLAGPSRGAALALINAANQHPAPVLSLDVPSGVDSTTGQTPGAAGEATATLTLALPKTGFDTQEGRKHVGELYLADISVPPALYGEPSLGIEVGPIFAQDDIVRLW
jgi:NAD(P)H-hydrate epimerase